MHNFQIIVAIDQEYGIGKNNLLPWHLAADMRHFKEITTMTSAPQKINAVIMGRKTWESLPEKFRPLPGRLNIVLTRNKNIPLETHCRASLRFVSSLDEALTIIQNDYAKKIENVFVIGGATIYELAIKHPNCAGIYLTRIQKKFDCDTFFPKFEADFKKVEESGIVEEKGIKYLFEKYTKTVNKY